MKARLISLNAGKPRPLIRRNNKIVPSSIVKLPVSGSLRLGRFGLDGDAQADLENHGGPDKAVCVYPMEHYPYWAARLERELELGAFGENFTTEGLLELKVYIGDVYRVGSATVQVSQPRQPCFKLAARHGVKELALWVQESGRTGFYLRCLKPGEVSPGDEVVLVERPAEGASVAEANRIMHRDKYDAAGIERLLSLPALSTSWRRALDKRLLEAPDSAASWLEGSA